MSKKEKTIMDVAGMSRDEIFDYLVVCVRDRGLYDSSLDPAIMSLAGMLYVFQRYFEQVVAEPVIDSETTGGAPKPLLNPAFTAMATLGEQIRKYMRDLGLVVAKPAGFVSQEKEVAPTSQGDRLSTMLEMVTRPRMTVYKRAAAQKKG